MGKLCKKSSIRLSHEGFRQRDVSMHAIKSKGIGERRVEETSTVDSVQVFASFRRPFMVSLPSDGTLGKYTRKPPPLFDSIGNR